ncbi:MAG: VWA domain-containing protein [Pyrinomonadaceae bacterium]
MKFLVVFKIFVVLAITGVAVFAQTNTREIPLPPGGKLEVHNFAGRVELIANKEFEGAASLETTLAGGAQESDISLEAGNGKVKIRIPEQKGDARIDLKLRVPERVEVEIRTREGAVSLIGNIRKANVKTDTATIYTDVSLENLSYDFRWRAVHPQIVSSVELAEPKEKAAGVFQIKGELFESPAKTTEISSTVEDSEEVKPSEKIELKFETFRGIVLLNVSPNLVPSNLRERPLTEAARTIVRSGDKFLVEGVRRAAPQHFSEFAATLPAQNDAPKLADGKRDSTEVTSGLKKVTVQVTDINNRAISGLAKDDFQLSERGKSQEIVSVESSEEPFNLVLLLDVSGSIEYYVDFVRKAARSFLDTASKQDRIAIVTFNDDVKVLSNLSADRDFLSESLDTFDAGGGTAFYDALAYSLVDTLRPLKGERTAIVVLSDGDDNRSFLSFDSLKASIQESGALIYPLYVPSGLIAESANSDPSKSLDPMRTRHLTLTSKAEMEGEELARISGGVFYPISRLTQLQEAYNDIVKQLRTAYTITYKSNGNEKNADISAPRLRVRVKRDGSFVKIGTVLNASEGKVSPVQQDNLRQYTFSNAGYKKPPEGSIKEGEGDAPEITGDITSIKYKPLLADKLRTFSAQEFDINKAPGAFLFESDTEKVAVSRWVSPKRTRSYPYERVYDTLAFVGKRAAIIPIVKDEGMGGERDFIQWDTISLLSLLDVYFVPAIYESAEKNNRRADSITKQKLDPEKIRVWLNSVKDFRGTAAQWNKIQTQNLQSMFIAARKAYANISKETQTYMHDPMAYQDVIDAASSAEGFIEFSRGKALSAQNREVQGIQPREALSSLSKAKITITSDALGKYIFTVDETIVTPNSVVLVEAKHSQKGLMPSKNDIKDSLIKMMLYTNLRNVKIADKPRSVQAGIKLTSVHLKGTLKSKSTETERVQFFSENGFSNKDAMFINQLFNEAEMNNFFVIIEHGSTN